MTILPHFDNRMSNTVIFYIILQKPCINICVSLSRWATPNSSNCRKESTSVPGSLSNHDTDQAWKYTNARMCGRLDRVGAGWHILKYIHTYWCLSQSGTALLARVVNTNFILRMIDAKRHLSATFCYRRRNTSISVIFLCSGRTQRS